MPDPDLLDTSAGNDDATTRARIARTTGDVHEMLVRLADNPDVPEAVLRQVRFAVIQAWNAGWITRGLDRRTGQLSINPFETVR